MLVRVLQLAAVFFYIFGVIGVVAYFELSMLLLIPLVAPVLYFLLTLPPLPSALPVPLAAPFRERVSPEWRAKIDARIEELKNGPPHRNRTQYIDSVSRGIPFSDDRIDYLEFPDRLVLCEHLRPLEAAMRAAGLPMDHLGSKEVEVSCVMRVPLIRKRFQLPGCVEFGQVPGGDNHAPPVNVIQCKSCGDWLEENGYYGGPWPVE